MSLQQSKIKDKFNIKFYVHVFPSDTFDWDCLKIDVDKKVLYVRHLFHFHSSVNTKTSSKYWCFNTNEIFLNTCQNEVYTSIASHNGLIEDMFLGINHTIISYGQNYSGKSFTMSGFHNQYELRGIIARFVVDLFKQLEIKLDDYAPKVCLSAVDIHKNFIYDLLNLKTSCKEPKEVSQVEVFSEVECLELLFKAEAQRIIVGNKPYNSHSATNVVTFAVRLTSVNVNEPVDKISKITFVDLAGVETISRNPVTSFKDQYNQGDANVTKTLLELYALRSKKTNKKGKPMGNQNVLLLTRYLGESFSPTSCMSLICHIRPHHEDIKITLSALKFGMAFQGIPMEKPKEHSETNYDMTLKQLTDEIRDLKDEMLIVNLKGQNSPIKLSQERINFVKRTVQSFLKGELSEDDLLSLVDDTNLILNLIKSIHNEPIPKSSAILQTDSLPELMSKHESIKVDQTPRPSIAKRVSLKIPQEKGSKTKDGGKSKMAEKTMLQSEEVQVNLIEPNVTIPTLDSREGLWAMFLISRPDLQNVLDRLNTKVVEKNKILNEESTKYHIINQLVNKKQLEFNQQMTYSQTERQVNYDLKGKVVMMQSESDVLQELRQQERELDKIKQNLIDAQFEWLEALEKLENEKQIIDEEFKQFCVSNNFVAIDNKTTEEEEGGITHDELVAVEGTTETDYEKVYCVLQKKYLHKHCL